MSSKKFGTLILYSKKKLVCKVFNYKHVVIAKQLLTSKDKNFFFSIESWKLGWALIYISDDLLESYVI